MVEAFDRAIELVEDDNSKKQIEILKNYFIKSINCISGSSCLDLQMIIPAKWYGLGNLPDRMHGH